MKKKILAVLLSAAMVAAMAMVLKSMTQRLRHIVHVWKWVDFPLLS